MTLDDGALPDTQLGLLVIVFAIFNRSARGESETGRAPRATPSPRRTLERTSK